MRMVQRLRRLPWGEIKRAARLLVGAIGPIAQLLDAISHLMR